VLLVIVVLATLLVVAESDNLLGRAGASTLTTIPLKYLIAGGAMVVGAACAVVAAGSVERGLFLLFVIAVPVRAVLRLGNMPADIEVLLRQTTASGNLGWIGYPLGQLSISLSDVPLAILWLRALPGLWRRPRTFAWAVVPAAALLVTAEVVSVSAASQPALAWWAVVETGKAVAGAAYVVYRTRSRRDFEYCLKALSIALALQAGLAIAQFVTGSTLGLTFSGVEWGNTLEGGEYLRASGTFPHPQMLAMYMGMFLPLLIAIALLHQPLGARAVRVAGVVAGSVVLILTFSRMGWLAAATGAVFVVMATSLTRRHSRNIVRAAGVFLLAVVATIPVWGLIGRNLVIERVGSELDVIVDLYRVASNMIARHPLAGVGINNFSFVMFQYDKTGIVTFYPAPVHNLFMLALAEMGPLGFLGLIAMIAVPAMMLWRARRRVDDEGRCYVSGLLGGLLVFCLLSLTGWTYYNIQTAVWFFIGTAMAAVRGGLDSREHRLPPHRPAGRARLEPSGAAG
jgi:O-antigen ligase